MFIPKAAACITGAAAIANLTFALPTIAQGRPGADRVQVMLLGTYHFANPGSDVVKAEVSDVLSRSRQLEIRAVVEALVRFAPTKIAVEAVPASGPRLDSLYRAYRSGDHELSRNEIEQLGFRLAATLEHPRVYPIDHPGEFPFDALLAYAQAHDTVFVKFVEEEHGRITSELNSWQREKTVGEILRSLNEPERLARDQATYMRFAGVGAGNSYVGAELVSKWYRRNIHIFANLKRIAEPGDRILVIIGSGHAPILRELISYDAHMVPVDPLEYLPRQ
ncbi:hypothetical protein HRbin33_01441 [bacterium HR33]|nr:hypothetical protein HRbin33_01441 [bacterium HR33]